MNEHNWISNLSLQISMHDEELSKMEKKMVSDLMKHRSAFSYKDFTIVAVARTLNVSTTSLHRLSKKLGYDSFTLFKEDYFAAQGKKESTATAQNDYVALVESTCTLINQTCTKELLHALLQAKRVTIYGMGMSAYLAKMFQIKLQLLGMDARQYDDSRYMRISAKQLNPQEDVILVLSRSGRPPELVEVMREANRLDVTSILITEMQQTPLEALATYTIYTASCEDSDEDIDTRVQTHLALDFMIQKLLKEKKMRYEQL